LKLQAKSIECNHLKRYVLEHRCDAYDATPGRRHHKVKATKKAKRKTKSILKTEAPVATAITPTFDLQNHCLVVVAVSMRSVIDSSHLSLFKHELIALLKASLNPILSEVRRYVAFIIHIVDLV